MKKYLKKSLIILVPVLLVWIAAEVFYRSVENNYTYKHQKIQEQYDVTEVLVLGNSHTFFGLNPEYFDFNTFNIANISQTIYFDKLLFEKHVDQIPNLKFIVLPVEYSSLSQQDNTSEDLWRKYFYDAQMNLNVPIVSDFDPRKYSLALTRRFNFTVRTFRTYLDDGNLIGCDENGWGNYYEGRLEQDFEEFGKIVALKHEDGLMNFFKNKKRLQEIIEACEKRGIKVLLVNMPVSKEYAAHINAEKWQKITQICQHLAETNKNTSYLPLFQNQKFSNSDFYDVDHLNHQGAQKASEIVNKHLLQYSFTSEEKN